MKWLLRGIAALILWIGLHCLLISLDGFTDNFSPANPADAEVIMGNEVMANATPSVLLQERLQKGLDIFLSGGARRIICSGGKGPNGLWEAEVMRDWLVARSVDPALVIVDNEGKDSYNTARVARKIFAENGWKSVLIVSHFTHISRCKLAFWRFGFTDIRSAHADSHGFDYKSFEHEFAGYYYYLVRRYN